jgi:tetratricopeptide (TPR) repeat protein
MRKLNGKFLCYLLVSCAVLGGGVALAHALQVKRIPQALLKQAQRAEDDNEPARVVSYLDRYLSFQPNDARQRARLARLLADPKLAATSRDLLNAYFALEKALALDPSQDDLRRLVVPIALRLGRNNDAREHLSKLPRNAETASLWGQWYEAENKLTDAIGQYREAVRLAPKEVETAVRLARLLRRHSADAGEADKVMNGLVEHNNSWQAYLARWEYRRDFSLGVRQPGVRAGFTEMVFRFVVQAAVEDVRQALARGGAGQPEVRLAAAEAAELQGQLEEARTHLDKALQLHSHDARLYRAYAALETLQEAHAKTADDKKACRARAHSWLRRGIDRLRPPAQLDALWNYVYFLLDGGSPEELVEADKYLAKMRAARFSPAGVDFLTGRLLIARQQWAEAARKLDTAQRGLPAFASQIDHMLARCYQELNQHDQRVAVCTRLVRRNPQSVNALLALIAALQAKGDITEALRWTRELEKLGGAPPDMWTDRIQLEVVRARQSNDWSDVEKLLDELSKGGHAGEVELDILRAEVQTAQGKPDEARKTLEQARTRHPARVEPWTALAALAQRQNDFKDARDSLVEAEKHFQALPNDDKKAANLVELRLARARFWVELPDPRNKQKKKDQLVALAKDKERFAPAERARLLNGLAEAHYRLGHYDEASRLWKILAGQEQYRRDLRLRLVLFDLALQGGHEKEMDSILEEIRSLEGAGGTYTAHAEALRLIWRARKEGISAAAREEALKQAAVLLGRVRANQPQWSLPLEALVQIDLIRGKPEQARNTYEEARKLGNRNPLLVRQIAEALRKKGKFKEEAEVYKTLNKEDLLKGKLPVLAAENALKTHNTTQAIEYALAAVRGDSRDFHDHLWLGTVLARVARSGDEKTLGEKHLRRALELAPTEAEPYTTLVGFLASQNRKEDAEELIAQARTRVKSEELPALLARCFAHLNKVDEARKQFETAVQARPRDGALLVEYADFFLRHGPIKEAEAALRRLLDSQVKRTEEHTVWGHTRLALMLAYEKEGNRFGEALAHVGLRMQPNGAVVKDTRLVKDDSDEVKRCAARVLATRPQWRCREEALRRFKALEESGGLNADDHYIMAHLYEHKGDWFRANEQLGNIASSPSSDLQHLTSYAQAQLRHGEKENARKTLDLVAAVVKARPSRGAEATLADLQARWHEANGEGNKAVALLEARVPMRDADPQEVLLLVASLGRQKRFDDALKLLDKIWKCPAELAGGTSVALLRATRATPEQKTDVAKRLVAALAREPKNVNLHVQLGDVLDLQGDYEKAEARYEEALKIDPNNLLALNNLAWLLTQRLSDKRNRALALINKALEVHGPRGELLDTRAVIYIHLGRPKEALADLEEACKEAVTPTRRFHLALAHQKARDLKAARRELDLAKKDGLQPADLHPAEQKPYRDLVEELNRL